MDIGRKHIDFASHFQETGICNIYVLFKNTYIKNEWILQEACFSHFICMGVLHPRMYVCLKMEPLGPASSQFHHFNTASLGTRVPAHELRAGRCRPYANFLMKISRLVSSLLLLSHPLPCSVLSCPIIPSCSTHLSLFPSFHPSLQIINEIGLNY